MVQPVHLVVENIAVADKDMVDILVLDMVVENMETVNKDRVDKDMVNMDIADKDIVVADKNMDILGMVAGEMIDKALWRREKSSFLP